MHIFRTLHNTARVYKNKVSVCQNCCPSFSELSSPSPVNFSSSWEYRLLILLTLRSSDFARGRHHRASAGRCQIRGHP